jgi:RNA polymerase sigma-70 factor (ECF subfamily)
MSNVPAIKAGEMSAAVQLVPPVTDGRALYRAELGYVWSTLRRLGTAASDLEDLTHEVFLVALERLPRYDATRPIRPWLFGIAFRVWVGRKRKGQREELTEAPELEAPDASPEARLVRAQQQRMVDEALADLEPNRKAVFIMHDVDGHSAPDIAHELEVPLNTVYSRLRLAREQLVQVVREKAGGRS